MSHELITREELAEIESERMGIDDLKQLCKEDLCQLYDDMSDADFNEEVKRSYEKDNSKLYTKRLSVLCDI